MTKEMAIAAETAFESIFHHYADMVPEGEAIENACRVYYETCGEKLEVIDIKERFGFGDYFPDEEIQEMIDGIWCSKHYYEIA